MVLSLYLQIYPNPGPSDFILFYLSYRESINQMYFFLNTLVIRELNIIKLFPSHNAIHDDFKIAFNVEVFMILRF